MPSALKHGRPAAPTQLQNKCHEDHKRSQNGAAHEAPAEEGGAVKGIEGCGWRVITAASRHCRPSCGPRLNGGGGSPIQIHSPLLHALQQGAACINCVPVTASKPPKTTPPTSTPHPPPPSGLLLPPPCTHRTAYHLGWQGC